MPNRQSIIPSPVRLVLSTFLCLIVILLALPDSAVAYEQQIVEEAHAIAEQLAGSETKTLAVVDFTDLQGNVTELGRFLAEELSIRLAGLGKGYEVVDRTHLKALLKEHKLSSTGLIDPATARELGRIAGVDALITGTVTPLGDSVRCAVKVLNTETAHIITSTTANIPKTQAIETLLEREIQADAPDPGQRGGTSSGTMSSSAYEFLFRLRRCVLSTDTLVCSFAVTNQQDDCTLTVTNASRVIDTYGDQYTAGRVQIANRSGPYWAREIAVNGIPIAVTVTFPGVVPATSRLALVEVAGTASWQCNSAGGSNQNFRVQFRDVPVSRK